MMNIINASLINFTTILLLVDNISTINFNSFLIKNGNILLHMDGYKINNNKLTLFLKGEVNIKKQCYIFHEGISVKVSFNPLYSSKEFNSRFYTKAELGASYTKDTTSFSLWSPAAAFVNLLIYENGDPSVSEKPRKFKMIENNGLWHIRVKGNLKGYFYTYQIKVLGELNEAVDPYAKAVGINGLRGAIIDLKDTDPKDFHKDQSPILESFTDAVIYEASVRDISMHPDSGIRNKGKYLGLTEDHTHTSKGISTGLQHISELGVTHIQLMPVFDFSSTSTDERNPYKYNWGYDPQNYNVPEGSYSSDPYYPVSRIHEFKKMVQHIHRNGLSIVMDVVYNHLFHSTDNNFHKIFPGYYFRYDESFNLSNGSGCGNDTASERPMVRRFIIDSLVHWVEEYHVDGFRFDLMGLHDIETMNAVRKVLNKYDRRIMVYGEGWNLNTFLPQEERANMNNAYKLPHIGHFSDTIRDTLRGSVFSSGDRGFVSGKQGLENQVQYCVTGCTMHPYSHKGVSITPDQSINYVSAHDNHTLWDKLELSSPESSLEELKSMSKLANAIVLTSQGIPFIHSGSEFCRTKGGIENSYNSTDSINRMDWNRKQRFLDVFEYYKGLIDLRKNHPAFRMNSQEKLKKHLHFLNNIPANVVAFMLMDYANGDYWKDILVIYNANRYDVSLEIPHDTWYITTDKNRAGIETLRSFTGGEIWVDSISITVLYRT
jgi:pullulanase